MCFDDPLHLDIARLSTCIPASRWCQSWCHSTHICLEEKFGTVGWHVESAYSSSSAMLEVMTFSLIRSVTRGIGKSYVVGMSGNAERG